ncbi:hypothetical protein KI387_033330 [Taxus chinensis]|uniref:F-box domain-containing protein n=1 Tax=Taxus chinensis TaxID=29808 RepID=A0AA38BXJ1_TAXCH|nr:hypothetical protein KI387_033330 [Taxus chinensis]
MEMEEVVWLDLPEELWLIIMARLPTRKCLATMKTVCKRWNELLSRHGSSCCSTSSFLFQFPRLGTGKVQSWVMEASGEFYEVPLVIFSAYSYYIELACNHMYCLSTGLNFSICNESNRDWKRLRLPARAFGKCSRYTFIGCGFDPCSQQCIIVLGNYGSEIECYDSQSDSWSIIDMTGDISAEPFGRGVYSKGSFYWLNTSYDNNSDGMVAELNLSERRCTIIPPPPETAERDYSVSDSDFHELDEQYDNPSIQWSSSTPYWELAGSEGQVILVDKKWGCMWKLETENKWCRVDINLLEQIFQVSVHSSGWTLVVAQEILLYDANKRLFFRFDEYLSEEGSMQSQSDLKMEGRRTTDLLLICGLGKNTPRNQSKALHFQVLFQFVPLSSFMQDVEEAKEQRVEGMDTVTLHMKQLEDECPSVRKNMETVQFILREKKMLFTKSEPSSENDELLQPSVSQEEVGIDVESLLYVKI